MTKELELLSKMDLTEENRAKLQALLEESKKTGKVASKKLVETLDAVDATEEQTEKFYDVLEAAGVEIDVSDVLDLIGTAELDNPTLGEMRRLRTRASTSPMRIWKTSTTPTSSSTTPSACISRRSAKSSS